MWTSFMVDAVLYRDLLSCRMCNQVMHHILVVTKSKLHLNDTELNAAVSLALIIVAGLSLHA